MSLLTPWASQFFGDTHEEETFTCSVCRQEDIENDVINRCHVIDGKDVCEDCTPKCCECSEYIDDESPADLGPIVHYRRSEMDGKLSGDAHAACAASWLVTVFSGDYHFSPDFATKEQINQALKGGA